MIPIWHLLDLDVFRETLLKDLDVGGVNENLDGTAFIAYRYADFPRQLVIAKKDNF